MNIGDVAEYSGLSAKTIRYYEARGLVQPLRDQNGYRAYRTSDAQKLRFLAQARKLGFSLRDCQGLLTLFEVEGSTDGAVSNVFKSHKEDLARQLLELRKMHDTIEGLLSDQKSDRLMDQDLFNYLTGVQ